MVFDDCSDDGGVTLEIFAKTKDMVLVVSSAISAPNLSKNGFLTNQIMTKKASTSCNHLCMDAMHDKQQFIGDEWAGIGIAGSECALQVGRQ